jgi:hypothetical protein
MVRNNRTGVEDVFVQLASNSPDYGYADTLKMLAPEDQKDFFEMLNDYRMAQAEVADEETEYKLMISEQRALIVKDQSMAEAEFEAMRASYNMIAETISGKSFIVTPRAGIVSAIYKKAGDLVGPEMSVAVITGETENELIARIQIPSNIRKPKKDEEITIIRPGIPDDKRRAKIVGVGRSLDEMGSYMADAVFLDKVEWPIGASVRALTAIDTNSKVIESTSVWSDKNGEKYVWGVSSAGRIFEKKINIGRTMGSLVEIYDGLKKDDRYIVDPSPNVRADMLIEDIIKTKQPTQSGGHNSMPGM